MLSSNKAFFFFFTTFFYQVNDAFLHWTGIYYISDFRKNITFYFTTNVYTCINNIVQKYFETELLSWYIHHYIKCSSIDRIYANDRFTQFVVNACDRLMTCKGITNMLSVKCESLPDMDRQWPKIQHSHHASSTRYHCYFKKQKLKSITNTVSP